MKLNLKEINRYEFDTPIIKGCNFYPIPRAWHAMNIVSIRVNNIDIPLNISYKQEVPHIDISAYLKDNPSVTEGTITIFVDM